MTVRSRRGFFKLSTMVALLLGFGGRRAGAEATVSKSAVGYQDIPAANGKVCAQCDYYVPLAAGASLGTCKLVAGGIAPGGWCLLWAPKA